MSPRTRKQLAFARGWLESVAAQHEANRTWGRQEFFVEWERGVPDPEQRYRDENFSSPREVLAPNENKVKLRAAVDWLEEWFARLAEGEVTGTLRVYFDWQAGVIFETHKSFSVRER